MTRKKLLTRAWSTLQEMYRLAEPPLSIPDEDSDWTPDPDWFSNHYLPQETYEKLVRQCQGRLSNADKTSIGLFLMNYGPSSNKENVEKRRQSGGNKR